MVIRIGPAAGRDLDFGHHRTYSYSLSPGSDQTITEAKGA